MRVGLRGAPHNKSWSIGTTKDAKVKRICALRINEAGQAICAGECCLNSRAEAARVAEDVRWCEMKAAEVLEQAVARKLIARGHEVFIADKMYRLGYPADQASTNTKKAMAALWKNDLDVALAIHTNSSSKTSRAFQAMYPTNKNKQLTECKKLCTAICEAFTASGYKYTSKAREFSSYEGNVAPCPHSYLEVDYGNSNPDAARDFLQNIETYAEAIVNGLEVWWTARGGSLPTLDYSTEIEALRARRDALTAYGEE